MADDIKIGQSLNDLYAHLSPAGVFSQLDTSKATDVQTIDEIIKDKILGPKGDFYTWDAINDAVDSYFKKSTPISKKDFGEKFHGISTKGRLNLEDSKYWQGAANLLNFTPILADSNDNKKEGCVISAFVSKDPFISPATKATKDVEIFLNYMPNLAVSQMVPFLEVTFEVPGQYFDPTKKSADKGSSQISTPSYMRFLLGSRSTNFDSQSDKFLYFADSTKEEYVTKVEESKNSNEQKNSKQTNKQEKSKVESKTDEQKKTQQAKELHRYKMTTGMETFLMPQTLTNMDELSPNGGNRLTQVKPFVPFATIEGLDVQVRNAGAGEMVSKTATLKIKLHDKARISEFSEFIRGPSGYSNLIIQTVYGWSMPVNQENNEYAKFINEKMYVKDCWMVKDSQFSFDMSGQVSFTIQLVNKGTRDLQRMMITAGAKEFADAVENLNKLRQTIAAFYERMRSADRFSIDVTSTDFLNAAVTSGDVSKFKDVELITKTIIANARHSSTLNEADVENLKGKLDAIRSAGPSLKSKVVDAIKKKFNSLSASQLDPFLPTNVDSEIAGLIKDFKKNVDARNAEIEKNLNDANSKKDSTEAKIDPIQLDKSVNVVSFGKLFMNFISSAVTSLKNFDELQVFFYPLNDATGPMSGHSIAEFPIDVTSLAYAYAEQLKLLSTNQLTLEQFLKLVITTQFSDIRAIGYGKNSVYKPFVPGNNNPEKQTDGKSKEEANKAEIEWAVKYGSLRIPMISFYFETNEETFSAGSMNRVRHQQPGKLIKRIHIYDLQLNPHKLAQTILSGESGLERGEVNKGKLRAALQESIKKLKVDQAKNIDQSIKKNAESVSTQKAAPNEDVNESRRKKSMKEFQDLKNAHAANAAGIPLPEEGKLIDRPNYDSYKISMNGKTRDIVKAELMRFVPTLTIGSNGTLIRSVNVGSKTDGAIGAANLYQVVKGGTGKYGLTSNGLEEVNELPVRVVPIQLSMTSLGCPIAGLYQQYFIDLNTGTTLDNLYKLTQVQHQMSQGKLDTSWTFVYSDGYGKFGGAPTVASIYVKEYQALLKEYIEAGGKPKNWT